MTAKNGALIPGDQKGKLSSIMSANAQLALPEIVSVFINKHETELYDAKEEAQKKVAQTHSDLELVEGAAKQDGNFDKFIGIKNAKLGVISYLKGEINMSWDTEQYSATIGLRNLDDKGEAITHGGREGSTGFAKDFYMDIPKKHIEAYKAAQQACANADMQLESILRQIADIPRKERQVKARISELRLEEQGLEEFIADEKMLALIAVK